MGDIEHDAYLADDKVQLLWDRFRRWNSVAIKCRKGIEKWRLITVVCTISGSVFATLATQLPGDQAWACALGGGLLLGCVPKIKQNHTSPAKVDEWVRTRTVAEAIKAEIFKFRTGIQPYNDNNVATTASQILMEKINTIDDGVQDLRHHYVLCPTDGKPAPPVLDRTTYIDTRVKQQINNYFRRYAKILATRGRRESLAVSFLTSMAALIGLVVGSSGGIQSDDSSSATAPTDNVVLDTSNAAVMTMTQEDDGSSPPSMFMDVLDFMAHLGIWVAVLTTAAAAISAQSAESKNDEISSLYSSTAQHLEDLYLQLSPKATPGTPEWEEFVMECETTIAVQYKSWMSKKTS